MKEALQIYNSMLKHHTEGNVKTVWSNNTSYLVNSWMDKR